MKLSAELSSSLEDYLEAIYRIVRKTGAARPSDISSFLNVKAGSVTKPLRMLVQNKLINYVPYSLITLTDEGEAVAKEIVRKHEVLKDFFKEILGAKDALADEGACKMEHAIPDELIERLITFTEFVQSCPRCGKEWMEQFHQKCEEAFPTNKETCGRCVQGCLEHVGKDEKPMTVGTQILTLHDIAPGNKCVVKKVYHKASTTKRLVEMGIGRGSVIEVERVAPLGDPVEIKVKGYHLSIRKEEALNIQVEEIKQ